MFSKYLQWWDQHPWVAVIIIVLAIAYAFWRARRAERRGGE